MIPIIIGVTGHRFIRADAIPKIEQLVREKLQEIQDQYKHSTLYVISPLAEGADRLVAKIALDLKMNLIVPLPLPEQEYEKDFETKESKAEFYDLLHKAKLVYPMPILSNDEPFVGENRDAQYAYVGAWVAHYSHILLALWDGVNTNALGGTAQIVAYKSKGIPFYIKNKDPDEMLQTNSILDSFETGLVYHLKTPRQGDHSIASDEIRWQTLTTHGNSADMPEIKDLKKINGMNSELEKYWADSSNQLDVKDIFPSDLSTTSGWFQKLSGLLKVYQFANHQSLQHQTGTVWYSRLFMIVVSVAVLVFNLYTNWWEIPVTMAIYWVLFILANGINFFANRHKRLEEKWYDDRALAEAVRIQIYWKLFEIRPLVTNFLLRKHVSLGAWIYKSITALDLVNEGINRDEIKDNTILHKVAVYWINGQKNYFKKKQSRASKIMKRINGWKKAFFVVAWVISGMLIIIDWKLHVLSYPFWHQALVIIATVLPVFGGLMALRANTFLLDYQNEQYDSMAQLYQRASDLLEADVNLEDAHYRAIMEDVGKAALQEVGDWLVAQYERRNEAFKG
jgi:uncharacterized membrane protein